MSFYKVVTKIGSEVAIDSKTVHYAQTLSKMEEHKPFLELIAQTSKKQNLPLDFYVVVNNNLALWGNMYLENLSAPKNASYELSQLTYQPNHDSLFIKEEELVEFIQNLDQIGITMFEEYVYLWEFIFEAQRLIEHQDKPSRADSFFLFDSNESCESYKALQKGVGVTCKVELDETSVCFKADMSLIRSIQNNYTYKQVVQAAGKYWKGETSDQPVFEYLFQGTCTLKP